MAEKLIELKDAAAKLGISPEKLQDMREAGEIHGYKDGTSWKFKPAELERDASELASPAASSLSPPVKLTWKWLAIGVEECCILVLQFRCLVQPAYTRLVACATM